MRFIIASLALLFSVSLASARTEKLTFRTLALEIFKGPLDAKGKLMNSTPTEVELPASSSILLIGWMEDEKPALLAVSDLFATVNSDDWLVINTTQKPVTIQIGATATTLTVEANSQQTIKCTAPVGEGAATTVATKQDDGSMKTVYSSFLQIYDDKRGLDLVVQKGERVTVNYIADQIAPKTTPKSAPKKC